MNQNLKENILLLNRRYRSAEADLRINSWGQKCYSSNADKQACEPRIIGEGIEKRWADTIVIEQIAQHLGSIGAIHQTQQKLSPG